MEAVYRKLAELERRVERLEALDAAAGVFDLAGTTYTMAANAITLTGKARIRWIRIDTSGGASENLNTISGGNEGDLLIVQAANSARTVVLKDAVDNLHLSGDFSLDNTQDKQLFMNSGGTAWIAVAPGSDNGA